MGFILKNKKINSFTVFSDGSVVFSKQVLSKNSLNSHSFLSKDALNSQGWMDKIYQNITAGDNYKKVNSFRNKFVIPKN